jgi:hypothetical protein
MESTKEDLVSKVLQYVDEKLLLEDEKTLEKILRVNDKILYQNEDIPDKKIKKPKFCLIS